MTAATKPKGHDRPDPPPLPGDSHPDWAHEHVAVPPPLPSPGRRNRRVRRFRLGLRSILPRGLFWRGLLIIVTPVVLLQAVVTIVFWERHVGAVQRRMNDAVAGEIAFALERLVDLGTEGPIAPDATYALFEDLARTLELSVSLDEAGSIRRAPRGFREVVIPRLNESLARFLPGIDTLTFATEKRVEVRLDLPNLAGTGGVLAVEVPVGRLTIPTAPILTQIMVASSVLLLGVAILFLRNQVRPINRLALAAERFGRGLDTPEFKPTGAREVRQAAAAFLVMRERIRRQIEQRTELLAGVSHDLRTPVTRMKLQLELLDPDLPGLADLRDDVAEMEEMIAGYIAFARGEGTEAPEEVSLEVLVNDVAKAARRAGADVTVTVQEDVVLPVRPLAFKRCVANLVANAHKYGAARGGPGGRVWLTLRRAGRTAEIWVDDDGFGIPPESREEVFHPFHRLHEGEGETHGAGLGLPIARDLARGHGGDVTLTDSPHGGLRAIVRLPI